MLKKIILVCIFIYCANYAWWIDTTAPTITNITSSAPNGAYRYIPGDVDNYIMLDITFSEPVTGSATVTLETGDNDRTCGVVVSGSSTATCQYFIEAGDNTSDLNVSSISGSIADGSGNAMSNFVPATNLAANKAIVIDSMAPGAPTVTTPTEHAQIVGTNSTATGTCEVGGTVSVSNEYFTSPIIKNTSCSLDGTFSVSIAWKDTTPINTSQTLNFVQYDAAGNVSPSATVVVDYLPSDAIAPTITNITSSAPNGAYRYIPGDVDNYIMLDITFSEPVTGSATVTLETGDNDRTCGVVVSGSSTATCQYFIEAGDNTSDLNVSSISGSIADGSGNAMSNFVPATNLAANKAIVIDSMAPGAPTVTTPTEHAQIVGTNSTATGTCEVGGTVSVSNEYFTSPIIKNTSCSLDGTFSVSIAWKDTTPINTSQTLNFVQYDAAGNVSPSVTRVVDYYVPSGGGGGGGSFYVEKVETKVVEEEKNMEKEWEKTIEIPGLTTDNETKYVTQILAENVEFEPFATRERTLSIALKLSGMEVTGIYICQNRFTDTPTPYSCEVAEKAQFAGLISQERTTFRPTRLVTRVEAYAIFMKSICVAPETNENNWQKLIIKKAIELGFTTRTIDTFRPNRTISTPEMFALARKIGEWKTNNPNSCENK